MVVPLLVAPALSLGMAPLAHAEDAASAVVSDTGLRSVVEVSHDGRWIYSYAGLLDRETGVFTPTEDPQGPFVRDNPNLRLSRTRVVHYRGPYEDYPVYLLDMTSGVRKRIDTDSRGKPLKPAWKPADNYDSEYDGFYVGPQLLISPSSISRNGRKAAFCANYETAGTIRLYVKDLKPGKLTRTNLLCGATLDGESNKPQLHRVPEMSEDGKLVHINGDDAVNPYGHDRDYWRADSLYFTASGNARRIPGWGSMTRNGGTVFMLVGVRAPGTQDRTGGKVGANNVRTRKIVELPGTYSIYGNDIAYFQAFDQASRRGRYVVNNTSVIDRTNNITFDYTAALGGMGLLPTNVGEYHCSDNTPFISGDGKVIVTPTTSTSGGCLNSYVTVTGWQPIAS